MKKYPVTLRAGTTHVGLCAAASLLESWADRKLDLTEDEFEELTDAVIELLGEIRNERYRFRARAEDPI